MKDVTELRTLVNMTAHEVLLHSGNHATKSKDKFDEDAERAILLQAAGAQLLVAEMTLALFDKLITFISVPLGREQGLADAIRDAANQRTHKQQMLDELKKVVD